MRDCGYASPFSGTPVRSHRPTTLGQSAGNMICMERLGYIYSHERRDTPVCTIGGWRSTDACLTGKRCSDTACAKAVEQRILDEVSGIASVRSMTAQVLRNRVDVYARRVYA